MATTEKLCADMLVSMIEEDLIDNGYNINFLRAQLGHKKIESVMHYYTQVSEKVLEQGRVVINKLNIADSSAYEPKGLQDYDVKDAEELVEIEQIGKQK